MKKEMFLLLLVFFITINVYANEIYNIDIDVYLDEKANANITETWHVKGHDGTEWYKPLRDLGNSNLSNYTVTMDNNALTEKEWNINESLEEKKGYYGINYNNDNIELCFGKSDYNEHTFVIKYSLSNYIFNTSDAQVLYWTYFSKFQNVNFQKMKIIIRSYYSFPQTLDVWGYGYPGSARVYNGIIELSNDENTTMNNNYAVALVKFPLNTFQTNNTSDYFETFDDVLNASQEGASRYPTPDNKINSTNDDSGIIALLIFGVGTLLLSGTALIINHEISKQGYGYINNKIIDPKKVPYFRDIPCHKDIYYANALLYVNNFNDNETNILGAIILKWIKEKKIAIITKQSKILKKEISYLDLRGTSLFNNKSEKRLFNIMYQSSDSGILESKKFEKYVSNNYRTFFEIFQEIRNDEIIRLKEDGHIYNSKSKEECKKNKVLDDTIYEDSIQLLGLKKFLHAFTLMKEKQALDVHIWDEYLMFAYLFGIADKVAKQLNKLYPQTLEKNNFDYNTFVIINTMSRNVISNALAAKTKAESYTHGGGGSSFSGGGGSSFGGGGFSGGGSR